MHKYSNNYITKKLKLQEKRVRSQMFGVCTKNTPATTTTTCTKDVNVDIINYEFFEIHKNSSIFFLRAVSAVGRQTALV